MHLYENTPDTVCANSDTNYEKKRGILLVGFSEFWCKRTPVLFQLAKYNEGEKSLRLQIIS